MTRFRVGRPFHTVALVLAATAPLAGDDQFAFMPEGGRTILTELLAGFDREAVHDVLGREASVAEWMAWVRMSDPARSDAAVATLANYAAINLPLDGDVLTALSDGAVADALPADGKDLSLGQCQSCHSLFSSYLMHDRDRAGWNSTFKSPFHTEIPMTDAERATFAAYSAINMPLDFDDVPPELRF